MSLIDFLTEEIAFSPNSIVPKSRLEEGKSFGELSTIAKNSISVSSILCLGCCLLFFLILHVYIYSLVSNVCIFPGEQLPTNERQVIFQNGTLLIKEVSPNDAGRYSCSVIQGRWTAKEEVLLQVLVPPTIEPFSFADKLQEGWRTRVTCSAPLGDLPIR